MMVMLSTIIRSFLAVLLVSYAPKWTLALTQACIDGLPSNVTTVSGDLAEFHCSAFCGIVVWLVNETSVFTLQQKHNLSYLSGPRSDGIHGEMSTLQIVANEGVNNTMIRCIVIDPDHNTIVNSSAFVYLLVQGRPLPPTNLKIHINNQCQIQLNWRSPFILSSEENTKSQLLMPQYIIYGFLYKSSMELFYRGETNSSSENFTLNFENVVSDTNFSLIAFSVSTKLILVGESNVSAHRVIKREAILAVCKPGHNDKQGPDDDHKTFTNYKLMIYICAALASMTLVTVVCILCTYYLQRHSQRKVDTVSLNHEEINLRSNCAYESRDTVTQKMKATTLSNVSQKTTEIITEPNESYEPCKVISPGFSTD